MHIYNIEKAIPEFIATTLMKSESKMKDQVRKTLITYNYIYTVYDYIIHKRIHIHNHKRYRPTHT